MAAAGLLFGAVMASASHPSLNPDPSQDPLVGIVLDGRYRLESRLGSGGMAHVYRAEQLKLGREVAVKVLHANCMGDPDLQARFEREARALARVNHEHILHAYDHGVTEDGRLYLVTELLSGHTLKRLIAAHPKRRMPLTTAIAILRQLACALEAVHDFLVHRDLKPHNVIVDTSQGLKAKLLDFGIVRPTVGSELTSRGIIGTPSYMSPEQIEQESDIDARSDLYSLGVMAYELLTGDVPFRSRKQIEVLSAHLNRIPPRVDDVLPEARLPEDLVDLVAQLLEKPRERRPESAAEVGVRLAAIETELGGGGHPIVSASVLETANALANTPAEPPSGTPQRPLSGTSQKPLSDASEKPFVENVSLGGGSTAYSNPGTVSELLLVPSRRGPLIGLAVAALVVLGVIGYASVGWRQSKPKVRTEAVRSAAPPTETTSNLPKVPEPKTTARETAVAPTPKPSPVSGNTTETSRAPNPSARTPAPPKKRNTRGNLLNPKLRKPKDVDTEPQRTTPAATPSLEKQEQPTAPVPRKSGEALVTARTLTGRQPIIEVSWQGRVLGRGARVRVNLPPGTHKLEVRRAGTTTRARTRKVRIRAGETTQAKVLLD